MWCNHKKLIIVTKKSKPKTKFNKLTLLCVVVPTKSYGK